MIKLVIVADDLTGAADTAAAFAPRLPGNRLAAHEALGRADLPAGLEMLAVYTDSRALPVAKAYARLRAACARLRSLDPGLVYKKLDSSLRGNTGAELDAALDALGLDYSLVAPAYPALGRLTRGGVHLVHGRPVGESEAARDPVSPVRLSRLPEIVGSQSRYPVAHVSQDHLADPAVLAGEIGRLVQAGARHVTLDAVDESQLDRILEASVAGGGRVLLAGSAGLAERLAARLFPLPARREPACGPGRPRLLVCGTASAHTREQLDRLAAARDYLVQELDPGLLAGLAEHQAAGLAAACLADPALRGRDGLIVRVGAGSGAPGRAERIVLGLGGVTAHLLPALQPACLFLSGGDTASAVLTALEAEALRVKGPVLPGTIESVLVGGPHGGLPVYTKAGAFGGPDTLVELDRLWDDPSRRMHP